MHGYSLNNNFREKAMLIILIFSLIANALLYKPIELFITFLCSNYSIINEIINFLDSIGIGINIFTLTTIFGLLYYLFDNHLWKSKYINKLHNVPDLNGTWEGGLVSSFQDENNEPVKMYAYFKINQTWSRITIKSDFSKEKKSENKLQLLNQNSSSSYSDTATFDIDNVAGPKLVFTYKNDANNPNLKIRNHSGCNTFIYKDNTLSGMYFTDRGNGTHGSIFLTRMEDIYENAN